MANSDQSQVRTGVSSIPTEQRTKLRAGFALCSGACALALGFGVVSFGAAQFASSSGAQFSETHNVELKLATNVASAAIDALLIAGLACLYLARIGPTWRLASTGALALLGVDVAIISYHVIGADPAMMELALDLGLTLNWVVLWMIAILAAEAAESMERPDITYQTEVTGRLIVWGGVAWLAYLIWSFDPKTLGASAKDPVLDAVAIAQFYASWVLGLFSLGRIMFFCGSLVAASSSTPDATPPGQTAG